MSNRSRSRFCLESGYVSNCGPIGHTCSSANPKLRGRTRCEARRRPPDARTPSSPFILARFPQASRASGDTCRPPSHGFALEQVCPLTPCSTWSGSHCRDCPRADQKLHRVTRRERIVVISHRRPGTPSALRIGMENRELDGCYERVDVRPARGDLPIDGVDTRLAELRQLIASVEKVQKIVLTEVRGLATKVDRLTRARGRGHPNP